VSAIDAAFDVLRAAGESLHYQEITKRMLAQNLWHTEGKTPWVTVNAQISVEIKTQGSASRFVRVAPGIFALNPEVTPKTSTVEQQLPPETEKNGDAGSRLTFTDAAEHVLMESGNDEPLHYGKITKRALDLKLIRTKSRTPAATMYAAILTEIRRQESRGESPRFVQHGRGMVGLSTWLPSEVAGIIEEKNREVRKSLIERARSASSTDFEALVSELLVAMGFEDVEVTRSSRDGGIDVRGTLVVGGTIRIRMAVQAKRWKKNVTAPTVQQVRGALGAHEQGLIITTSDFSKGARDDATRADAAPVALMNGEQMAALLAEYEIGASVKSYKLFVLDQQET